MNDYSSESTSYSYEYSYEKPNSNVWLATVPLIISIIACVTVLGNTMVIAAYIRSNRIRANVANIFILNLSVTDFIVGAFMWPINLTWLIKGYWSFGEVLCKVWLITDYTVSVVSVLTMVLISWDRYCLLTMGVQYQTYQTNKRVTLIVLGIWIVVFTWYTVLAFAWSPVTGMSSVNYAYNCEMEFTYSLGGTVLVNVLEFFIPLTALLIMNIAVYVNIKRRSKGIVGPSPLTNQLTLSISRNQEQSTHFSENRNVVQSGNVLNNQNEEDRIATSSNLVADTIEGRANERTSGNNAIGNISETKERTLARHRKAAVVLAILVGGFLICWLPIQFIFRGPYPEDIKGQDKVRERSTNFHW
ncbi:histamine H3 receptor-like [Lytechinus pictus]|uniref:histamine H3 receptor-like n=1 Tax=Lytechinus pictus TaxID=7653 RepID=UPI0030B9CEDF